MARRPGFRFYCLCTASASAAAAACSHAVKQSKSSEPVAPCQRWEVTVSNEFTFPLAVYLYAKGGRALVGAATPGFSTFWVSDSGQVTFSAPLGQTMIARGRQASSRLKCVNRIPTDA